MTFIFTEEFENDYWKDIKIRVFEHKKFKTKIYFLKNNDNNKAFNIAFRTPSPNSQGFQHIIEHSVLRGSKKYNGGSNEVFSELMKKSINTNMNASTYSDFTQYYFSTLVDFELFKMMDVYLNSVFFPLVKQDINHFRQEGWRIDKDKKGNYFYNGVVLNEMKGYYSIVDEAIE